PVTRPATDSTHIFLHLPDVQGYLQEEVSSAQKLLKEPTNSDLWELCRCGLVNAIRTRNNDQIWAIRHQFACAMANRTSPDRPPNPTTVALAWAIIVESALLNDQLLQDMKESAGLKGCAIMEIPEQERDFYRPEPSPAAKQAFNQYVACRWPIHVFALDPAAWEQNIASTFSMRREMQLALALAFTSGRMSANNMMQFARRLEFDFATVDLNGTAVGFSHGDDTFGWRFYPRFQVPDVDCNLTVFFRDQLWGGPNKNDLLKQRRLEPGIRECYAVVVMPSFVPYATLRVSSNWFSLVDPKRKVLDTEYAVRLSNRVKQIESCAPCVVDGNAYRDDELERLKAKNEQLAARLPLQSTMVQIPYENTLGGFGMFNTGVTDLAPELIGWYGTSSINPMANTTVFLAGDHFSVHLTTVIAGGQQIPASNVQLLSRQVVQVVIPQNPILVGDADQKFVDVQLATPYGVTQHLLIPAAIPPQVTPPAAPTGNPTGTPTQSIAWNPATFQIAFAYSGTGIVAPPGGSNTGGGTTTSGTTTTTTAASTTAASPPNSKPATLLIQQGDVDGTKYDVVDVTLKFDKKYGVNPPTNAITITGVPFDSTQSGYPVQGDSLATQILNAFGRYFGPEDTNPPSALSTTTTLKFRSSANLYPPITTKTTSNGLTIQWIKAPSAAGGAGGAGGATGAKTSS
ncbi:MAG TPA: hypothetical protein VEI07_00100, partial [Planctomycetaceae bacterium]|nr:hypothetical protein [Planctomycetaceae bacterium]